VTYPDYNAISFAVQSARGASPLLLRIGDSRGNRETAILCSVPKLEEPLLTRSDHPRIRRWISLRTDKRTRSAEQAVLLTSPHEIEEILPHVDNLVLIVTPDFLVPSSWPCKEVVVVCPRLLEKITGLPAPQGCAAEVRQPSPSQNLGAWILVLDAVQDPGNCGTLLRTALALGWTGVWLLPGTVDLWNEKVLRSAKGAQFKLPYWCGSHEELLNWAMATECALVLADLVGQPSQARSSPCALVLSNEGKGPSTDWNTSGCQKISRVTIPLQGSMESLNVASAGAILMASLRGVV